MTTTQATKLARFMTENKLKPLRLAREAGMSRQQLVRIRTGAASPRMSTATCIRDTCGRLLRRAVSFDELFDDSDPQALRMRS